MLDGIEFLALDHTEVDDHGVVTCAHAVRLCWSYGTAGKPAVEDYLRPLIDETVKYIRDQRNSDVPFFGDDFWDWSYVLDALYTGWKANPASGLRDWLRKELQIFFEEVVKRSSTGPFVTKPQDMKDEWYGPAIPTAVYRLLTETEADFPLNEFGGVNVSQCRAVLKQLALQPVIGKQYLGRTVKPDYLHWHLGQVAAQFPSEFRAQGTASTAALSNLEDFEDKEPHRAYALARVIQGSFALNDTKTVGRAQVMLQECERDGRSFGIGQVSSFVKASLNALEGLWPSLNQSERDEASRMVDTLIRWRRRLPVWNKILWLLLAVFGVAVIGGLVWFFHTAPPPPSPACPEHQQHVPYQGGSPLCASDALANFLLCLEASRLSQVSLEAKKALAASATGKQGDAEATAKLEASTVEHAVRNYSATSEAAAGDTCRKVYERAAGITLGEAPASSASAAQPPAEAVTVAGLVTDENDRGIADVKVLVVGGRQTSTSVSGSFSFALAQSGPIKLHLEAAGFRAVYVAVDAPDTGLTIQLKKESAGTGQLGHGSSKLVCYSSSTIPFSREGGCYVQCDKGPGNTIDQFHTFSAQAEPACRTFAQNNCKGSGTSCLYDYVPLSRH